MLYFWFLVRAFSGIEYFSFLSCLNSVRLGDSPQSNEWSGRNTYFDSFLGKKLLSEEFLNMKIIYLYGIKRVREKT